LTKVDWLYYFYNKYYMKQKIKAALQQAHKNLGITDEEVFERVASAVETFITDEAQIPEFVSKAESMLKLYQSEADKARTANKRFSDLEAELKELKAKETPNPQDGDKTVDNEAIQKMIADALDARNDANKALIEELQAKITGFESARAAKEAITNAHAEYEKNDWVKGYPNEAKKAWELALKIHERLGDKTTSDELLKDAMDFFGTAVAERGQDINKPFEGGGGGESRTDFSEQAKLLSELGVDLG
jgi:hypothetical protein